MNGTNDENEVDGIIMDQKDNVGTLYRTVKAGEEIHLAHADDYFTVVTKEEIKTGHKCALTGIECGEDIVKYGEKIGFASIKIPKGSHVHIHNIESHHGHGYRDD